MSQVVITADDLGLNSAWDAAIRKSVLHGVVSSVSIASSGPHFAAASRFVLDSGVDHGVHLCLLGSPPLSRAQEIPDLVEPNGHFPPTLRALLRRWGWVGVARSRRRGGAGTARRRTRDFTAPSESFSPESEDVGLDRGFLAQIKLEWSRQIQELFSAGLRPTHLNSHFHLHLLPGLSELAASLAQEYRIPFVRIVDERLPPGIPLGARLRSGALQVASKAALPVLEQAGQRWLRCQGTWAGTSLDLKAWDELLARIPEGPVELLCHPGQGEEADLALLDPRLKARLAEFGKVVGFGELVER